MSRITIVECDAKGCTKKCEIREEPSAEVFTILQVTDTMGKSFWFCGADCLRKWLAEYKSPYTAESPEVPPEAMPELAN